jgi:predicted RNA binding protein YcfA (HicA-like mRNA interferase family)
MPRTQKEWIKILRKAGWTKEVGGNHQTKMTKSGSRPITLPEHKGETYSKGLDGAIKKQAGL